MSSIFRSDHTFVTGCKVTVSLHPCQRRGLCSSIAAIFSRVRWDLSVVLTGISLIIRDVESFPVIISHLYIFFGKMSSQLLPIFNWIVCSFLPLSFKSCLGVLDPNPLSDI